MISDQPHKRSAEITSWLKCKLAAHLEVDGDAIDPRLPFVRYGVSSTEAVVMVGELEEWLGEQLPATLLWDYPSIAKLATYLANRELQS